MPSRKQRRRRQKERRHDYEYVYVDDEGKEVEPSPEQLETRSERAATTRKDGKPRSGKDRGKSVREYKPPSWKRSLRRALLFLPLFFIVFSLVQKNRAIESRLLASFAYSALFVPLTYIMD